MRRGLLGGGSSGRASRGWLSILGRKIRTRRSQSSTPRSQLTCTSIAYCHNTTVGGGGVGMTPWCIVLVCRWRRLPGGGGLGLGHQLQPPPNTHRVGWAQTRPLSSTWVPPPPRDPSPWGRCYPDGAGTPLPQQVATRAWVRPCGVRNAAKATAARVNLGQRNPSRRGRAHGAVCCCRRRETR